MAQLVEWSVRASVLVSMCLFAIGLIKIALVIYVESTVNRLVHSVFPKVGLAVENPEFSGISEAIHGIEYLFLAPLPFIVFASAVRYIARSFSLKHESSESSSLGGEEEIFAAKRAVIGLIIGTIGAVCVSRLTGPHGLQQGEGFGMGAVILALALYVRLSRE